MMKLTARTAAKVTIALLAFQAATGAGDWSEAVEVRYELKRCVSYRARLAGEFLVVRATHEAPWHTFAMDNKQRAEEKLAGRQALGIDSPTEIRLTQGLTAAGPWYQSPPKDFSRPELRWFSWGFDDQALFVAKVRRSGAGPARIEVRGQVCTETICKQIDVEIPLPLRSATTKADPSSIDLKALVQVRSNVAGSAKLKAGARNPSGP